MRPRVLVADDHALVADGIARLLSASAELVGTAHDGHALLRLARTTRPDVVVTDLGMPGVTGLDAMRQLIAEQFPGRFIAVTVHQDPTLAGEVLRLGARGFVVKQSAGDELIEAVRVVAEGGIYVSRRIAGDVFRAMAQNAVSPLEKLSPRQREVVTLLARGRRMKEIAAGLGISVRTVEHHKYEAMQVLEVDTLADLVRCVVTHTITPGHT